MIDFPVSERLEDYYRYIAHNPVYADVEKLKCAALLTLANEVQDLQREVDYLRREIRDNLSSSVEVYCNALDNIDIKLSDIADVMCDKHSDNNKEQSKNNR